MTSPGPEATEPTGQDGTPDPGARHEHPEITGRLDHLAGLIEKLVPSSHAEAQQREQARLDRPSSAEEHTRQITREELARAEQERADREHEHAERQSVKDQLAKLAEKPPVQHRSAIKRLATHGWE